MKVGRKKTLEEDVPGIFLSCAVTRSPAAAEYDAIYYLKGTFINLSLQDNYN